MLLKSSFVKWVSLPIFQKYISVHFLQIHKPLDSIISKCLEISIDPLPMKSLWSYLISPEVSNKSQIHIFRALSFCLVVLLIMIVSTLVDELDGVLGEGPEDLKTLMNQASSPLTMSMKPFLCMSYSTILLLQRNHDVVVTTLMGCLRHFLVDTCIMHDPTFL